ncbi:uncharacterized protein LOC141680669 [Apium graveolens]|uniref:uncharacterized protein LOC141680669 n=1 Tax=Apium graveolens TaxID=4045 RepID=UPI003D794A3F
MFENLKIQKDFAAVYHPQSNEHTEAINKIIKHTLKIKLEDCKGDWPWELPKVLWSYNTTPRSTTGEKPFMLTYDYEAMVSVEVEYRSLHISKLRYEDSEVTQQIQLDLLEEVKIASQVKLAAYQQRVSRFYNRKVKVRPLKIGDLVLRRVLPNTKITSHGVFGANWEGPYKVRAVLEEGTYYLEDLNGKPIPRVWNAEHLPKYFQ